MINFSHYEKVVREGLRHVKSVFVYEGTCVKYVWARVNFSRMTATKYHAWGVPKKLTNRKKDPNQN